MRASGAGRGFTLIEVLVATVVLAMGLLAALTAFSMATRATGASTNDTIVPMLAARVLADLQTTPKEELAAGTSEGDFGEEYPDYTWAVTISPPDDLNVVRVEVTIGAPEMGRRREVEFATDIF